MKHMGLAIALAVVGVASAWAETDSSAAAKTYVPRADRNDGSVLVFKGSGKGLIIKDNRTGEELRYTTKKQKQLHRLNPEAEASAKASWDSKQAEAADYEAKAAEEAAAAKEAADEKAAEDAKAAEAPKEAAPEASAEDEQTE